MDFINIAHAASESLQQAAPFVEAATEAAPHAAEEGSSGVIGTLGINWKLFIAQLVNFGIVLLVLWKWVLTPIAKKLQERTERIEKSLRDAQNVDSQKAEFETWRKVEMSKTRQEATGIVNQAKTEATKAKNELLAQARAEQEEILKRAEQQITAEKDKMIADVKAVAASLVTSSIEKILGKNLDDKLDKGFIDETLKRSN